MTTHVLSATSLIGDGVINSAGDDLGKITELMIDLTAGRVAYAVLSFGGFLGLGDKLFAVPWEALTVDTNRKKFVFNIEQDRLENAPGFDQNHWPDMADPRWGQEIHTYYGYEPYWEQM